MRLTDYYRKSCTRFADRPAVVFGDRVLTYEEFGDRTARLANALREMGLRRNHRVAVLMENRPEFLVTEAAVARAGLTCVPLNNQLNGDQVRRVLSDVDASALVVGPEFLPVAREIQQEAFDLRYLVAVCEDCTLPVGFQRYERLIERESPTPPAVSVERDDTAAVFYTSGTTGPQKGVLHTHRSLLTNATAHVHELDLHRHERLLVSTPLAHSTNFIARAALGQGATLVLQPGFDSRRALRAIEEQEITWTFLVPTMVSRLLRDETLPETDTSSVDTIAYGAGSMPPALVEEGIDHFGRVFIQVYGLIEAPDIVAILHKHSHDPGGEEVQSTVGYPTHYADIRVETEESRWGEDVGEVMVRTAFDMEGYLDQPATDTEWIATGDLGRLTDDGQLVVLDRIQDTIRVGDRTVFSTRVENVVQRHPSVQSVAVIGVPAEEAYRPADRHRHDIDQRVKAVVSTAEGAQLAVEGLREFCADYLAEYELPDSVDFVGALPETPNGKVDKRSLRQPYW